MNLPEQDNPVRHLFSLDRLAAQCSTSAGRSEISTLDQVKQMRARPGEQSINVLGLEPNDHLKLWTVSHDGRRRTVWDFGTIDPQVLINTVEDEKARDEAENAGYRLKENCVVNIGFYFVEFGDRDDSPVTYQRIAEAWLAVKERDGLTDCASPSLS